VSDREYAVWTWAPLADPAPTVTPAGNRYWAERRVMSYSDVPGVVAKVVYRYTFMPGMPWEEA
jgi:hypothetical protein